MSRFTIKLTTILLPAFVLGLSIVPLPAGGQSKITNENPPPRPTRLVVGPAVLLDDVALGGTLRTCVGANGALGDGGCPVIDFSPVGLRFDPDGAAGPLLESEDVNEGTFEERWCVEFDSAGIGCNDIFQTDIPGFTQTETSTAGRLQSTGRATTPDGRLRIDQIVTVRRGKQCVELDVTLTNVSSGVLTDVEYLRNHDPDLGVRIVNDFTTDNQTVNRPLPGGAPPMFVAATVRDTSPIETRSVGLGTSVLPPAGGIADVSIERFSLIQTDPDAVLDGDANVTRGPLFADVGNSLAFRIAALSPGEAEDLSLCYCFASTRNNVSQGMVAADLSDLFEEGCGVIEVAVDIKPGSFPNPINPRSKGVVPVAILSTADFDAADIDPASVRFGPAGASPDKNGKLKDVNGDGRPDLVLHFRTQSTGIVCGMTEVSLFGFTFAGRRIEGSDSIKTPGCH